MKLIYLIVPLGFLAFFILIQIFYSYKEQKRIEKRNKDKYPRAFKTPKVIDIQLDEFEKKLS